MPGIRTLSAPGDARQSLTGKDAVIYNKDGVQLATADAFQVNISYNNQPYVVLGDPQEHETADTYKVTLTLSHYVIEDDSMIQELAASMKTNRPPHWTIRGSLLGHDESEQSMTFRDCLPSGQIDLQNFQVNQTIKRSWNFIVNRPPELSSFLTYNEGMNFNL